VSYVHPITFHFLKHFKKRRVFMFGWVTGHSAGIVDTQAAIALLMSDDKKGKLS